MAISPNDTFTSGQILTAAECNAFPFGVVALASSTTSYTLTTSAAIATGMTVTFTAIANRYYKITYYEPQVATSNVSGTFSSSSIRLTSAGGTIYQTGIVQTVAALTVNGSLTNTFIGTFPAVSTTIVGCGVASNITNAPTFTRSATAPAFLLVEDIGPA